jgi:hypothetical protein
VGNIHGFFVGLAPLMLSHEFSSQRLSMASAFYSNMGDRLVHGFQCSIEEV